MKKNRSDEKMKSTSLDVDHRLLLKQSKPLLQSRNAAVSFFTGILQHYRCCIDLSQLSCAHFQVVMGVAQLYHHLAPKSEVLIVAKALVRLLRSRREVQSVVLNCIASLSTLRRVSLAF